LVVALSPTLVTLSSQGSAQTPAEKPPFALSLTCGGFAVSTNSTSVGGGPIAPGVPASPSTTVTTEEQIPARVLVDIEGDEGRIFLPRPLSLFREDWKPLYGLAVDERGISSHVRLNLFVAAKVTIDRMTGDIQIGAFGSTLFAGNCERIESERKF
jgi:hypothetical protein